MIIIKINKDKVMKYLLEVYEEQGCDSIYDIDSVYKHFGNIARTETILSILANEELIEVHWADNKPYVIAIMPEGHTYFEDKISAKKEFWKALAISKTSDIVVSAITAVVVYFVMDYVKLLTK